MQSKKTRNFKKHIQELYLERLQTNALFAQQGQLTGKVKIVSRKKLGSLNSESTKQANFIKEREAMFLIQQEKLSNKSPLGDFAKTSVLNIKKLTKAVEGRKFTIIQRSSLVF